MENQSSSVDQDDDQTASVDIDMVHLTSPQLLEEIIRRDGTQLDIFSAVSRDDLDRLTTGQVMALLRHPKVNTNKLEYIQLSFCRLMTDEVVLHISNHCPNLRLFEVGDCSLLTGAAIEALISNCNKITYIGAWRCNIEYIPEDIGVQAPQLQILYLFDNHIQVIPPSVALCNDGRLVLDLCNNPIQTPPREIALGDRGRAKIDDIRRYYESKGVDYSA